MTPEKPGAKRTTDSVPHVINARFGGAEYRGITLTAEAKDLTLSAALRVLVRAGLQSYKDSEGVSLWDRLEQDPELRGFVWLQDGEDDE